MSSQTRNYWAGVAALLLVLSAVPAEATVLGTYSDRAAWEALVTARTDINFSILGLAVDGYTNYGTVAGLTTGGVNFTGINDAGYDLWAYNPPAGNEQNYGSGTILRGPDYRTNNFLRLTLPANVTAFGIDVATIAPAAQSFQVVMNGVTLTSTLQAGAYPNRVFFGVRTDTAISELKFYVNSGTLFSTKGIFDNVSYGTASAPPPPPPPTESPEATTLLYIGSGLGLLFVTRRRKRAAAAA